MKNENWRLFTYPVISRLLVLQCLEAVGRLKGRTGDNLLKHGEAHKDCSRALRYRLELNRANRTDLNRTDHIVAAFVHVNGKAFKVQYTFFLLLFTYPSSCLLTWCFISSFIFLLMRKLPVLSLPFCWLSLSTHHRIQYLFVLPGERCHNWK